MWNCVFITHKKWLRGIVFHRMKAWGIFRTKNREVEPLKLGSKRTWWSHLLFRVPHIWKREFGFRTHLLEAYRLRTNVCDDLTCSRWIIITVKGRRRTELSAGITCRWQASFCAPETSNRPRRDRGFSVFVVFSPLTTPPPDQSLLGLLRFFASPVAEDHSIGNSCCCGARHRKRDLISPAECPYNIIIFVMEYSCSARGRRLSGDRFRWSVGLPCPFFFFFVFREARRIPAGRRDPSRFDGS